MSDEKETPQTETPQTEAVILERITAAVNAAVAAERERAAAEEADAIAAAVAADRKGRGRSAATVAQAVSAEREACARLAEAWTPGKRLSLHGGNPGVPRAIAAAIRQREA
ncbi:MAG: hypothetical protein KGL39_11435 [Patescibacteria group bacterium]|nr:hypothetical protein [Patescibacteria group bacterium]